MPEKDLKRCVDEVNKVQQRTEIYLFIKKRVSDIAEDYKNIAILMLLSEVRSGGVKTNLPFINVSVYMHIKMSVLLRYSARK